MRLYAVALFLAVTAGCSGRGLGGGHGSDLGAVAIVDLGVTDLAPPVDIAGAVDVYHCKQTLDAFCAVVADGCTRSLAVAASAATWCSDASPPGPVITRLEYCGPSAYLTQSVGMGSSTLVYDTTTGLLVAVLDYDDFSGALTCLAGPSTWIDPGERPNACADDAGVTILCGN